MEVNNIYLLPKGKVSN